MLDTAPAGWQAASAPVAAFPDRHQRRLAFQAVRRHSRRVRRLRVLLPLAGGLVVLALGVVTRLGLPADLDLSMARLSVTRNSIIMDHPHLTGFDADKREYSVEAARAIQALTRPDQVRLEEIRATVTVAGQGTATIRAASGDYDNAATTLKLTGGIAVDSSQGYALTMQDADIDLRNGTMRSANPVTISYQDSRTSGQSISVTEGGQNIALEGGVTTILMPPKRAPAPAAPAEPAKE
jgi:lipopolysaccharide export system protein LptC